MVATLAGTLEASYPSPLLCHLDESRLLAGERTYLSLVYRCYCSQIYSRGQKNVNNNNNNNNNNNTFIDNGSQGGLFVMQWYTNAI